MMTRLYILVAVVSLLLFSCFPRLAVAETGQGIAVWDMEDAGDYGDILTAKLCEVLTKSVYYSVVERSRLQRLLEEQKIGSSTLADQAYALRLGKMTGARLMVFGSYTIFGSKEYVIIRLVDVETSKTKYFRKMVTSPDLTGIMVAVKGIGEELVTYLDSGR